MANSWISFLVTGHEDALMNWQLDARGLVELFDRRGQTVHCRAHAGPPFLNLEQWTKELAQGKEYGIETAEVLLQQVVEMAKKHDVTVQRLDYADGEESYPVIVRGSHGLKWPPSK